MEKREILYPGKFYHIFNRGINKENIFYTDLNYNFFLKKINQYLSDFLEIYTYCLLPNHFHLLVKIKDVEKIKNLPGFQNLEGLYSSFNNPLSRSFSNLFNSYAKAINKQQNRTGSLFQKNYKRKLIDKESYLIRIIYYIHLNPVVHYLTDSYENYSYSSFQTLVSDKKTKLKRENILEIFEGKDNFIKFHQLEFNKKEMEEYYLE
jgi:REP element-mobilizing transposase RayT